MSPPTPKLTVVSGTGGKGPACFLVETTGARLLLDLGYGPRPGLLPDVTGIGKVDALLLSHGHRDHAGGLVLLPAIGDPPVYATEIVAGRMRNDVVTGLLPFNGTTTVAGISVRTGRSGHAPGGIWIHLAVGDGLLYMGDYSTESALFAHDAPPRAGTIVVDGSYGADDTSLADCQARYDELLSLPAVLLPVPADGRGPEIALYCSRHGRPTLRMDEAVRASLRRMAGKEAESLRPGVADEVARIADAAVSLDAAGDGIMLATRADATEGEAARLVAHWADRADPPIVFSGDLTPGTPAEQLVRSGRALARRWNVHPRLSENVSLVRATGAATVVPAFCEPDQFEQLTIAFAPARVTIDSPLFLQA